MRSDMDKYYAIFRTLALLFMLSILYTAATASPPDGLTGDAFSDTGTVQEMPEGWEEMPVRHDPALGRKDIVVTLDQHLYPALLPIIMHYGKTHGLKISVSSGTCGISSGKLAGKAVDIGGFCCPPGFSDRLPGLRFHTFGIAPVAILVHPDNPIDGITLGQARQAFQGTVRNWSEISDARGRPGRNIPVLPVGRLHCKIRPGHWRLLLDNEDLFSTSLHEVGAIPDMIALVSSSPGAIGYEVMWMTLRYGGLGKVRALKINGIDPGEVRSLISGDYPLYRTYNITTWHGDGVSNRHAEELVEHIMERAGQIEAKYGIIPASALRQAGWKFSKEELVGEPD
jgi:ABC-type phosphate transport system substrate-binding protein